MKTSRSICIAAGEKYHSFDLVKNLADDLYVLQFVNIYPKRRMLDLMRDDYLHTAKSFIQKKIADKLGFNSYKWVIRFGKYLDKVARPCSVFHVWSSFGLEAAKRLKEEYGTKIVIEHGSTHPLHQAKICDCPTELIERQLEEFDLADRIIVPSDFVYDTMVNSGVDWGKLRVIPYGVNTEKFQPRPLRVLYVGRTDERKGLKYLYQAITDEELTIVGGEKKSTIPASVRRVPHTAYIERYYHNADVLVHPSLEEGQALSVLEAMACGLPVIVTEETGVRELLGDLDTLIPSGDSEAIWNALKRHKRKRGNVRTWKGYADDVFRVYQGLYE